MAVFSISTFATGDTIEASWANTLRDWLLQLDARTGGDPGVLGKLLVSSGVLGGAWLAPGAEGKLLRIISGVPGYGDLPTGAVAANLGYTPANKAGETFLGNVVLSGVAYIEIDNGVLYLNGARDRYLQWNAGAGQYTIGGNADIVTSGGRLFWNSGNDGAGSGLDADLLDGLSSAAFALLAGATFTGSVGTTGSLSANGNVSAGGNILSTGGYIEIDNGVIYLNAARDHYIQWNGTNYILGSNADLISSGARTYWNSGNDGAGSGLDADVVDGLNPGHSTGNIAIADGALVNTLNADLLDGLDSTQLARLSAASNFTAAPTIGGSQIWTAANDGAGSGLDADTLDGHDTAFFQPASSFIGKFATGSYTGTSGALTVSSVGFSAAFIAISDTTSGTLMGFVNTAQVLVVDGAGSVGTGSITVTGSGFTMSGTNGGLNVTGHHYTFTAFGS